MNIRKLNEIKEAIVYKPKLENFYAEESDGDNLDSGTKIKLTICGARKLVFKLYAYTTVLRAVMARSHLYIVHDFAVSTEHSMDAHHNNSVKFMPIK